jgi:hypothetical protein
MMVGIDFGDRWDDPVNRWLCHSLFYAFCFSPEADLPERFHTNVVAITGPGTAFDDERDCRLADIDDDTILVIEVASTDVHWAEPGDLPPPLKPRIWLS